MLTIFNIQNLAQLLAEFFIFIFRSLENRWIKCMDKEEENVVKINNAFFCFLCFLFFFFFFYSHKAVDSLAKLLTKTKLNLNQQMTSQFSAGHPTGRQLKIWLKINWNTFFNEIIKMKSSSYRLGKNHLRSKFKVWQAVIN